MVEGWPRPSFRAHLHIFFDCSMSYCRAHRKESTNPMGWKKWPFSMFSGWSLFPPPFNCISVTTPGHLPRQKPSQKPRQMPRQNPRQQSEKEVGVATTPLKWVCHGRGSVKSFAWAEWGMEFLCLGFWWASQAQPRQNQTPGTSPDKIPDTSPGTSPGKTPDTSPGKTPGTILGISWRQAPPQNVQWE